MVLECRSALLECNGDSSSELGVYEALGVRKTRVAGRGAESTIVWESKEADGIGMTLDPGPFNLCAWIRGVCCPSFFFGDGRNFLGVRFSADSSTNPSETRSSSALFEPWQS